MAAAQQSQPSVVAAAKPAVIKVVSHRVHPKIHRSLHVAPRYVHHRRHGVNTKILQAAISTPSAWVVQLASFSQEANAKQLTRRLRTKGFEAYTRTSDIGGRRITRVFVGPEIDHYKMNKIEKRLHSEFHLQGVVRKYHV